MSDQEVKVKSAGAKTTPAARTNVSSKPKRLPDELSPLAQSVLNFSTWFRDAAKIVEDGLILDKDKSK
jgi:hypothetical protein